MAVFGYVLANNVQSYTDLIWCAVMVSQIEVIKKDLKMQIRIIKNVIGRQ